MDIQFKRFTLNAIAAAILALNTETAYAASCPAFVIGTVLAGTVCEFDTGSSITVANGGEVGGITMTSYNPASPSSLQINAGGLINATTGVGITISSSTLSNGLTNNGTINIANGTGVAIVSSSVLNGGINNTGLISTGGISIVIASSTVTGGIINSGSIISNNTGTGIRIGSSSTIAGGILNSGTIQGSGVDPGISVLNNSNISGGINNTGLINSSGLGNGILIVSSSTVNGGIYNSGVINSTSSSAINILNFGAVQGDITNSGTISGGTTGMSIHNAALVSGNIQNSGLISGGSGNGISIYSSTTIGGAISNSGIIRGTFTGIAVASSSTVAGGISNSGTIQGGVFGIRTINSNVSNINIIGKQARIIGAVEAPTSAFNITSGALYTSEGAFNVNTFNISTNAVFNLRNTITANDVNNAGLLGLAETSQTIVGNYTQMPGGVFQVGVSSINSHGALQVSGIANFTASGNLNVQVGSNSALHDGDVINVFNAASIVDPAAGYMVTDNSYIWNFRASNSGGTSINLLTSLNSDVYNACLGSYCQGAAATIINQVKAGNPAFGAFATLPSQDSFETAVAQATPELTNENQQVTQLATRSVMDIVPMWSVLHGQSAGDAMLAESGKVWFKPYGASMVQQEANSVPGFSANAYGLVAGKDMQLADWLFGGAISAGKDNMRGKAQLSGQTLNTDIYQALVYGARRLPHQLFIAAQGLLGYGNNSSSRSIPLYASTASGSFNSWFTNLRAQLGWNAYKYKNLLLTPELDASYLYIYQGSYRESGSPMSLNVSANNNASLVIGAYGYGAYSLTEFNKLQYFTLIGYVGLARNVMNGQPQTSATFVAGGPSFSTFGIQFNQTVFRGGIGLNIINPTKPLRANLNYDLQSGNSAYSGIGSVTITYKL